MAEGRSNGAIAATLVVSERAVEKHVGNIFSKLGLAPSDAANGSRHSRRWPPVRSQARFRGTRAAGRRRPVRWP